MLFSLGDCFTHTGLRLNAGQSNDLPPTISVALPTDCFPDWHRAPCCVPLSCTLFRRGRPALRAPEHEQMFVKKKKIEAQNNKWNS